MSNTNVIFILSFPTVSLYMSYLSQLQTLTLLQPYCSHTAETEKPKVTWT
jgi:hypothetical protein